MINLLFLKRNIGYLKEKLFLFIDFLAAEKNKAVIPKSLCLFALML